VLKAAVAGGAFAVPLIASFSMDAASAQTHLARNPVSNQVSNMSVVSNMLCSNQSFEGEVPTGLFTAEVAGSGPHGPGFGIVRLAFLGGPFAQLDYQIEVRGHHRAFITELNFNLEAFPPGHIFIEDPGRRGRLRGHQVTCGGQVSPDQGLATLFEAMAAGHVTVFVELSDGTELSGPVTEPRGFFF
jgi:hypothetical protein